MWEFWREGSSPTHFSFLPIPLPKSGAMASQYSISQRRLNAGLNTSSSNVHVLPLATIVDESKTRKRRMGITSRLVRKDGKIALLALLSLVIVLVVLGRRYFSSFIESEPASNASEKGGPYKIRQLKEPSILPLSKYWELSFALEYSDIVALYFAASWCGMSTPVSIALDEAFGESGLLLTPNEHRGGKKPLSIVYISSDRSVEDYDNYLQDRKWIAVPYESSQRRQLKEHFATCAKPEVERLGIQRIHEIPTIIVIDSQSHDVLTYDGVKDVKELGFDAFSRWKAMQQRLSEEAETR